MAQTIELAQTAKRDFLISLESKYQSQWKSQKIFQVDPPPLDETRHLTPEEIREKYPKWFGTFAFPYMNGSLHLGHAFTISKIEFAAGYQRMLGKRVLFPLGFHVTGMPIKASADKIIREMELFGPDFENFPSPSSSSDEPTAPATAIAPPTAGDPPAPSVDAPPSSSADKDKSKGKKGKIAAKSTGHTYQFQIMQSIGVPLNEIKKFADPLHWLTYFPPIAIEDNNAFGSRIDWRRTFMTTPANPYFDSFVRWQMNKLYALQKIKFGERYTIYSPKDGQPCMDHDRQDGEGVGPLEYTGVKMEVVSWPEGEGEGEGEVGREVRERAGGRKVFLVAATLRPETMYGQTNCFIGPHITYGLFAASPTEAYICTLRSARNMAFQGIFEPRGEVNQLMEIEGGKLVGTKVKAPMGIVEEVWVLPMESVLETKGTGVVTSVPSDSPDDYATLLDLRKKASYYHISPTWASIDPIPVLRTPTYGTLTAPTLYTSLKIQSPKDKVLLAEAKDLAYKEGFYSGVMLVGEWKGLPVQDAKGKVRDEMIRKGLGIAYAEPDGVVVSRSGDECIVALMDQWYLDYGEPAWRAQAEGHLRGMELYTVETRHAFEATLNWLNQWACARTYGLGSVLPWDRQFLVESLSDSTVYMAYYTVAQLLHEDDMTGSKPGPLGITPEQMTDEIWEYILCGGPFPPSSPSSPSPSLPQQKADILRHSFTYFYPLDVRSSAKDLIPNHLTFFLYNHIALFPASQHPRAIRVNGHLMLNGKKMSKSTGNSLTLKEAVRKFGADACRLSLADAGDGVEDANFDEKTANANILRVYTLIGWAEEVLKDEGALRKGDFGYHDRVFEEEIKELIGVTQGHYEATNYKDALKYGFYELQTSRDWYREVTTSIGCGMHISLVRFFIRTSALLIAPIAPHFAEHLFMGILGEKDSIQRALWPTPEKEVDRTILEEGVYMRGTVKGIRDAEGVLVKKLAKLSGKKGAAKDANAEGLYDPKKSKAVRVYVSDSFPEWQDVCVGVVKECWDGESEKVDDARVRALLAERGLGKDKRAMPFVQAFKKRITQFGPTIAFRRTLPFSELKVLSEISPYLVKSLGLVDAEILSVKDARERIERGEKGYTSNIVESAEPGSPAVEYRNV